MTTNTPAIVRTINKAKNTTQGHLYDRTLIKTYKEFQNGRLFFRNIMERIYKTDQYMAINSLNEQIYKANTNLSVFANFS